MPESHLRGTGLTRPGTQTHDYAWRGEPEPPAVTAARERWRAHEAQLDALAAKLDALAEDGDSDD